MPSSSERYHEALALFKEQKFPEAVERLESLLRDDPSYEDTYEALSILYSKSGELDKAIETARAWIRLNPHSKMGHVNLSRFYAAKGLIAEAEHEQGEARRLSWIEELKEKKLKLPKINPLEKIERFKKVIALDPGDVLGYYSLGDAFLENKMFREASQAFLKAVEVDPGHSSSYWGLGQAFQALDEKEKAKGAFEMGIRVADAKGDRMTQKKMEARLRQLTEGQ